MRFRAFSRQQRRVLTWWCSAEGQSREAVICDGAVRSGKTLCMGLAFFLWATACFDGMAFGLCGKTITALRRNLLREVLPTLGALGFQWREQASQNRLTVRLGGKENTFYLFGGRDEGSAALIQGITLAGVLLDEAALMPRSFVEQACARCSVPGSRMWFSCNPEHPEHWFYKEWILKAEERRAGGRPIWKVVADPSAASFIETLRRRGWRVEKADNDVLAGIRTTAELLRRGRLVICQGCADALREFTLYCWDEKAGGDRVKKVHDHAMDDIRYFAASVAAGERGYVGGLCVERGRF